MEAQTKFCRNSQCELHEVLFDTIRKRCVDCNSKLKPYNYQTDSLSRDDRPPLTTTTNRPLLTDGNRPAAVDNRPAVFESDCDIEGCPVAPAGRIVIPFSLYQTWVFLAQSYAVEWIAYLLGKEEKDGTIKLAADGMYFPEQIATGVHVSATLASVLEGTIASIHSHVAMSAFFSQEDKDHFNHPSDLVINRAGEMQAVIRKQLDCKRWTRVKAKIELTGSTQDVGAVAALREKLTIDKTPQQSSQSTIFKSGNSTSTTLYEEGTNRHGDKWIRGRNGLVVLNSNHPDAHKRHGHEDLRDRISDYEKP